MFLIADTTQTFPPYYLVTGDMAILVQDAMSVSNMIAGGIPLVQGSPEEILSLTMALPEPPA